MRHIGRSSLMHGTANGSVSSLWPSQSSVGAERLWRAVLEEQVHDLFDLTASYKSDRPPLVIKSSACVLAESWVGTYPSRNFCMVCDFAGLDSEVVHARLTRLLALPEHIRADYKFQSITHRAGELWADICAFERGELVEPPVI